MYRQTFLEYSKGCDLNIIVGWVPISLSSVVHLQWTALGSRKEILTVVGFLCWILFISSYMFCLHLVKLSKVQLTLSATCQPLAISWYGFNEKCVSVILSCLTLLIFSNNEILCHWINPLLCFLKTFNYPERNNRIRSFVIYYI